MALGVLFLGGCAGGGDADADATAWSLRQSLLDESSRGNVDRLANADNGLQLSKWLVADDPDVIVAAVSGYVSDEVLPPDLTRQLRRNGLRFVRLPVEQLETVLDGLGGATINVEGWQGQILQWRAVHEMRLGRERATIAVDGHVHRYSGGSFALLARCWTMPMENGHVLQLELMPEYVQHLRAPDLRVLLGQERPSRPRFLTLGFDVQLQPGFAYLLTYESPDVPWTAAADVEAEGDDATLTPPPRPAYGPGVGPEAIAPPTLGEMLFTSRGGGRPGRGMLIFVPRIPRDLYPQELRSVQDGTG